MKGQNKDIFRDIGHRINTNRPGWIQFARFQQEKNESRRKSWIMTNKDLNKE